MRTLTADINHYSQFVSLSSIKILMIRKPNRAHHDLKICRQDTALHILAIWQKYPSSVNNDLGEQFYKKSMKNASKARFLEFLASQPQIVTRCIH